MVNINVTIYISEILCPEFRICGLALYNEQQLLKIEARLLVPYAALYYKFVEARKQTAKA